MLWCFKYNCDCEDAKSITCGLESCEFECLEGKECIDKFEDDEIE